MLIVRHLGTPNSDFNGCHCTRDPVLYRSMFVPLTTEKAKAGFHMREFPQLISIALGEFKYDRCSFSMPKFCVSS